MLLIIPKHRILLSYDAATIITRFEANVLVDAFIYKPVLIPPLTEVQWYSALNSLMCLKCVLIFETATCGTNLLYGGSCMFVCVKSICHFSFSGTLGPVHSKTWSCGRGKLHEERSHTCVCILYHTVYQPCRRASVLRSCSPM